MTRFALIATAVLSALCAAGTPSLDADARSESGTYATILLYHRFGPVVADSMTVTTPVFAWQLKYLHDHGYTVVPLREVVNFAMGRAQIPPRAVAIVADDGHRTVFTEMRPLVERYRLPVTLFIYPSAISNASYAMTWEQLRELKETGLFDIQSHTYWHPNFKQERRKLSKPEFDELVGMQLTKPILRLRQKLGVTPDMLAWPFGIYDEELIAAARRAGYIAGFSMERRPVRPGADVMALPRYLVTNGLRGKSFETVLEAGVTATSSR